MKNHDADAVACPTPKPRLYDAVGWSWLVTGVTGLLTGLLGLPALGQVNALPALLARRGIALPPALIAELNAWVEWITPMAFSQIALSALITAGAAGFLMRRSAGRIALEFANALTLLALFATVWAAGLMLDGLSGALGLSAMIEAGELANIPTMTKVGLWGIAVLTAIPLFWMAWWFRSEPVRRFAARPVHSV